MSSILDIGPSIICGGVDMAFMGQYTESNSCRIKVENTYPGDLVEIATDVDALQGSDSGVPVAIWACYGAAGSSSFAIRRVAVERPDRRLLGLSTFSMDSGVLTLQGLDDTKNLVPARAKVSDDLTLSSFIEVRLYVWAKTNTKSVTMYCQAGPANKIFVELCGQSRQFAKSQSRITFNWINQYVDEF